MSQSYEAQGIIHSIDQTKEYGDNGFQKREFVILITGPDVNIQYPDHVKFELVKDKCGLMDQYVIGSEIKVHFNLGGRLWAGNGKGEQCFVGLGAWKIEAVGAPQQVAPQYAPQAPAAPQPMAVNYVGDQLPQAPQPMAPAAPQMATQPIPPAPQPMAPKPSPEPQAAPQPVIAAQPQVAPTSLAQVPPGSPESKALHPDGSSMYDAMGFFQPSIPF